MRKVLILAICLILLVTGSILMYHTFYDVSDSKNEEISKLSILDPLNLTTSISEDHELYRFSIFLDWNINGTEDFNAWDEILLNATVRNSENEYLLSYNRSVGPIDLDEEETQPYTFSKEFTFEFQGWDYINNADQSILDSDHYLITTIRSGDDRKGDLRTFKVNSLLNLTLSYERNGSFVDLFWAAENTRDYDLEVTYPTNSPFTVRIIDIEGNYVRTVYEGMLQAFHDDTWVIGEERDYKVTWRGDSWNESQPVDDGKYIMECKFKGTGYTKEIEIELIRD